MNNPLSNEEREALEMACGSECYACPDTADGAHLWVWGSCARCDARRDDYERARLVLKILAELDRLRAENERLVREGDAECKLATEYLQAKLRAEALSVEWRDDAYKQNNAFGIELARRERAQAHALRWKRLARRLREQRDMADQGWLMAARRASEERMRAEAAEARVAELERDWDALDAGWRAKADALLTRCFRSDERTERAVALLREIRASRYVGRWFHAKIDAALQRGSERQPSPERGDGPCPHGYDPGGLCIVRGCDWTPMRPSPEQAPAPRPRIVEVECEVCAARVEFDLRTTQIPDGWSWFRVVRWVDGKREEIDELLCPPCTDHHEGGPF